ncbi:MAG: NotI family restriction endonuclease [Chloroflexota bacterium]
MPFPKRVLELYTYTAEQGLSREEWQTVLTGEYCRYLEGRCDKIRKSQPKITIGSCTAGFKGSPVMICPHRFLQRRQIFMDALHLLRNHTPGNQLHVVSEIAIPGGSVDYFVTSVSRGEVRDYVALEIQTLDTTGTVWPARQQFLEALQINQTQGEPMGGKQSYGMNWKMTAKTILVQLHHKLKTLELLGKNMVLVFQDVFFHYVTAEFSTSGLRDATPGDSAHFHVYSLNQEGSGAFSIELAERRSTTAAGIEQMLGMQRSADLPEEMLLARIQAKISDATLLRI